MKIQQALLNSFDSASYTATVQIAGSHKAYLEGIAVARNIPAAEMVPGRKVAVLRFDEHNPREAVVAAVYS